MLFDAVSSYFFAVVKKKIGIFISICFRPSPSEKLSPRRGDEKKVESTRFVVKSVEKISKGAKDFHENAIYR